LAEPTVGFMTYHHITSHHIEGTDAGLDRPLYLRNKLYDKTSKSQNYYSDILGRFRCHVTCRLTAKNRDQLRNPTLGNRVWAIPFKNGRNGESPTSGSAGNAQTDAPRSIDIDLHGMQQANAAALCGVRCIVYRQQQMGSGCWRLFSIARRPDAEFVQVHSASYSLISRPQNRPIITTSPAQVVYTKRPVEMADFQ